MFLAGKQNPKIKLQKEGEQGSYVNYITDPKINYFFNSEKFDTFKLIDLIFLFP